MPPVPVCPSPRPQDSVATVQEQTANTIPGAEEALAAQVPEARCPSNVDPAPPVAGLTWRLPARPPRCGGLAGRP